MFTRARITTAILLFLIGSFAGSSALGEEPARAFLDGLRARGMQDTGIDYLDLMQTSRLAPPEFRQAYEFEKAVLLVELSRAQADPTERVRLLNQAQTLLQKFVDSKGSNPKANAARSQLGNLLVERARMKSQDAKKENDEKLKKQARSLYQQSFKVFGELQKQVDSQLSEIPKVLDSRDRKQSQLIARRKQLRADYLETELFAAAVREELADQLPPGSTEQNKLLGEAEQMYEGIYKKYRTRLAGLYSRMYQARCNRRLGKNKDALGYLTELLDQPSEPESMLILKSKALRMALETWVSPSENKYLVAIKRAREFLDDSPRGREREPDWLAIRYSLATAYQAQADDARRAEPIDRQLISRSIQAAKRELELVATESGELQEPARELLKKLGGPEITDGPLEIDTFDLAQAEAKKALDAIGTTAKQVQQLQQQLAAAKAGEKQQTQKQLQMAQEAYQTAKDDAVKYYRLAIELADESTPQSNVNLAQYFLCYVYFVRQDYLHSALVGDFVARRYPQSAGAIQCAKICMASYLKLAEVEQSDNDFEIEQLVRIGRYLNETWPGTPDTEASIASLVPVLINAGQVLTAAEFVSFISEKSPARGQLELVAGQSVWGSYLADDAKQREWRQASVPEEIDFDEFQANLNRKKESARRLLVDGFKRLPEQPEVTTSNATALLSLAQIHVEEAKFADAVKVIEHASLGPLTLVSQNSDATSNPVFVEETYRTALRSYVASLSSGSEMLTKAKSVMAQMQKALGSDDAGKKRMLGVYVNLAQDIEKGMKSATPQARVQMSEVFESFLTELSQGSSELSVLSWVAETFASLGSGLEDGDATNDNAKKYFEQSVAAFQNILAQPTLPKELQTQTKARLADVTAKTGDFQNAFNLYRELLGSNASAINLQVATAQLLQDWGQSDQQKLEQAISGDGPIWGWVKIALTAVRHKQFRESFFLARLQTAKCQFAIGEKSSDKKWYAAAERTISKTAGLYPTLGGAEMYQEFDRVLKEAQKAAGKPAKGLDGLGLKPPMDSDVSK